MVVVKAEKDDGVHIFNYFAKTSFFLFGNRKDSGIDNNYVVPESFNPAPDILIYNERQKVEFNYNRERTFPVRIIIAGIAPYINAVIKIIGQRGNPQAVELGNKVSFVYFPAKAESGIIRRNYFSQDLVVATYKQNNIFYSTAYTIPFGIRIVLPENGHNMELGIGIFVVFLINFFILTIKKRRYFYESL